MVTDVEWSRAWNGNVDLQVCLDYYAVIGYITEYYQKIDPGLLKKLTELVKKTEHSNLQESMRAMMNNYISARQMGECEALWRIMPDFHLKDSDAKVIFIPTCKPEQRSKFLVRVDEKMDYNGKEKKIIENREGIYVEKYSIIDKYIQRDKDCPELDNLSAAQFFKMYNSSWKKIEEDSDEDFEDCTENKEFSGDLYSQNDDENSKFHFVMQNDPHIKILLPQIIKLDHPHPGEPPFMRKRTKPAVLRFHKYKQDNNTEEYFYSEALLYTPFRTYHELDKRVELAAEDGYKTLEKQIRNVKSQVMEFLESNEEARAMVEQAETENKIGDMMDAFGEQENEEDLEEEPIEHPEYFLNPDNVTVTDETKGINSGTFRPIQIDCLIKLKEQTRKLDFHQRKVVEIGIKYCRGLIKSQKMKNPLPRPRNVIVSGGAGSGKSKTIEILSKWCHHLLEQDYTTGTVLGDVNYSPYVIKLAPTGSAAANIGGQTMHTAFSLNWGNEFFSLHSKKVDEKRNLFKNLKIVIIDEYSLMKADDMYKIDKRLKELTGHKKLWGNVMIFLFGDIMQLKPVQAKYIFELPSNKEYHPDYHNGQHWSSFDCILLEENHRQNEDKSYAEMLNRFRIGKQMDEDLKTLQTRVRKENHEDLKSAMFISCTNAKVKTFNEKQLFRLEGETKRFEATIMHPTIKNYDPEPGKKGEIMPTNFMKTLLLKVGARIQLIHNLDVGDGLTNGTRGTVKSFIQNKNGKIETIMIEFDEEFSGKETRKKNPGLAYKYQGLTPIKKITYTYSITKKSDNKSAKLVQFPLR